MSGWEDGVKSREPSPEEQAIRHEEEERDPGGGEVAAFSKEERDVLESILKDLLRADSTAYITFQEFLQRRGQLSVHEGKLDPDLPTGFYTHLGDRWNCAANTIKNWLMAAVAFIPRRGRERLERRKEAG